MVRPPSFDINGIKSGVWSKEEDDTLRAFVQKHGHRNWQKLPSLAGLARSGKSCRLRWVNYLQPGLKKGNFSKEEVDLIIRLHNKLGNKWSAIAEKLPGRTDNDIKNHWHAHIKKRSRFVTRAEEQSFDQMNCCKESNDQTENTNFEAYDDRLLKREEELNDFGLIFNSSGNEFSTLGLISHNDDDQLMNTEFAAFPPDQEQFVIDETLNIHVSPFISQFSTLGLCNNHTPTFSADSSDGSAGFDHNQLPEEYYSDLGLCYNHTPITSSDSIWQGSFW